MKSYSYLASALFSPLPSLPYWFLLGPLLSQIICIETLAEGLFLEELELKQTYFWENVGSNMPLSEVGQHTLYLSSDFNILNGYSLWLETSSLDIERAPQDVSMMEAWV